MAAHLLGKTPTSGQGKQIALDDRKTWSELERTKRDLRHRIYLGDLSLLCPSYP